MIESVVSLMQQAKEIIDSNPETRLDWAHASSEDRTMMLLVASYKIGFDDGYNEGYTNAKEGL
jgi:hypothetical protein